MTDLVTAFFDDFQRTNAGDDLDAIVSKYADPFMSADPSGTRVVHVKDFKAALPKRKHLFRSIGCKATTLVSLDQTPLDDRYILVRTEWRFELEPGRPNFTLPSTFILRKEGDDLGIVFYLTHQDIMTVFRERGLLPTSREAAQ